MPNIRPITDLRNNSNIISEFVKANQEPIFITKNGVGDMVIMSIELYELQQAKLELYSKLRESEVYLNNGDTGKDYATFAKELRNSMNE